MSNHESLLATINDLAQPGKGILAADESSPTIAKRFQSIQIESTEENRRAYRDLILSTTDLGDYVSGVILFEETLGQKALDGTPFAELCNKQGIVPGIKVDKGKGPLPGAPDDEITFGLDGLADRLAGYKEQGARFAKWRNVYHIGHARPSRLAIEANAETLARYAAICQQLGVVPIVEPEVLIDGDHSIDKAERVSTQVLHEVFHALHRHDVLLEGMILKPSMIIPGKDNGVPTTAEEVAERTVRTFKRTVPAAVPSINFLSGGLSPEQATAYLSAMNRLPGNPWQLSFSYGRALQEPALNTWRGKAENVAAAQQALLKRARLNGAARTGEYTAAMESE